MVEEDKEHFKRLWQSFEQAKNDCITKSIKEEIKKTQKNKGINEKAILGSLKCVPNFLGVYAEDETANLTFNSFPSFIIVNLDKRAMSGSHWISVGIFRNKLEIFDSLGFQVFNWPRLPLILFQFFHRLSVSRSIKISKRIQSDSSSLCGFYAIFYVLVRQHSSFSNLQSAFHTNTLSNDKLLLKYFLYIFKFLIYFRITYDIK